MSVPNFYVKKRSKNYHRKWPYWNAAQNVAGKTVVQNALTELLPEKLSGEATIKNDSSERLLKSLSTKTVSQNVSKFLSAKNVVQNFRTEMLAGIASEKNYH